MIDEIKTNDGELFWEISESVITKKQKMGTTKEFTLYTIVGRDNLGPIDIKRRYREFLLLRDILYSRYPGLMVPPMPGK